MLSEQAWVNTQKYKKLDKLFAVLKLLVWFPCLLIVGIFHLISENTRILLRGCKQLFWAYEDFVGQNRTKRYHKELERLRAVEQKKPNGF